MNNKYLPSKKFITTMSVALVVVISIFIFFYVFPKNKSFFSREPNKASLNIENATVSELIQNDSDGDGIPDWEESLWGTNKNKTKTFDDTPDVVYVENKKKELGVTQNVDTAKLTETEKFAREFFSGFTAMNASGQVDKSTIDSFSNALGQKIVNPALINRYNETDIKIDINTDSNSPIQKQKYYETVGELFRSYQEDGIGDELDIVNSGLVSIGATTNTDPYIQLPAIANAYQDFAKKMMELTVPSELATYHLQIANNANNTGISVLNMREIIKDPLVGLEGISQYQKYSEDLVKAVANLETALAQE